MIKDKIPLNMYEVKELAEELKETEKLKEMKEFIKKFGKSTPAKANKIKEDIEKLEIMKLKNSDIAKIIDVLPENAIELNKIFTEVSLDAEETDKILNAIKNNK